MANSYYIPEDSERQNDQELQDAYDEYLFTVLRDEIIEKQWLDEELNAGEEIMCVFDDRDKVVKMWRDNNILCMQVNYGNF